MMRKILAVVLCIFACLAATGFRSEASLHQQVDLDLTLLDNKAVHAQIFQMLVAPEEYTGKTVRMQGNFTPYQAPQESPILNPGQHYLSCVITDEHNCCSQGIDFQLAEGGHQQTPYPAAGSQITVVGRFQLVEVNGYSYTYVADARLE